MTHLRQSYVTGHTKKLRSLVFNPTTPNLLATCALDGFVKIWNLASAHSCAFAIPSFTHDQRHDTQHDTTSLIAIVCRTLGRCRRWPQ